MINKYGMVGDQKSVDGSKEIGATALYFSTDMGYMNIIQRVDNNNITVIKISGMGGRTIDADTNKYTLSFNQPLGMNLAMLTSAEHSLPIWVYFKHEDNIVYLGLWSIISAVYEKLEGELAMSWVFTLHKAKA